MLLKWITCDVTARAAFDRGQRGWVAVRGVPGFVAQCGGWAQRMPNTAHLFACWDDEPSYLRFMASQHDGLAAAQQGSYVSSTVRIFRRLDPGGAWRPAFDGAAVLRVVHLRVHPDRVEHFAAVQLGVWVPGMLGCAGLLGGMLVQGGEAEFVQLSMWRSAADHDSYLNGPFADLRDRSGAAPDVASISGHLVDIEPAWSV
jgi:hypothetical protein